MAKATVTHDIKVDQGAASPGDLARIETLVADAGWRARLETAAQQIEAGETGAPSAARRRR